MKIVRLNGGLGNQMFQYAFAKELKYLYPDDEILLFGSNKEVEKIFDIDLPFANTKDVMKLGDIEETLFGKIKRHYFRKNTHILERNYSYNDAFQKITGNVYYDGYWQTEKYFPHFQSDINNVFEFKAAVNKKNLELVENKKKYCSIHIRRGDYTTIKGYDVIGVDYYNQAINYIKESIPDVIFVFFSNDIEWCRKSFHIPNAIFVDWNQRENSWQDLWLMSKCQYNIIANSTFSWWGAYLGDSKIVIAPKVWMNRKKDYYNYSFNDIIPETWKRI